MADQEALFGIPGQFDQSAQVFRIDDAVALFVIIDILPETIREGLDHIVDNLILLQQVQITEIPLASDRGAPVCRGFHSGNQMGETVHDRDGDFFVSLPEHPRSGPGNPPPSEIGNVLDRALFQFHGSGTWGFRMEIGRSELSRSIPMSRGSMKPRRRTDPFSRHLAELRARDAPAEKANGRGWIGTIAGLTFWPALFIGLTDTSH
jgi:hypothetical protein